MSGDLVVGLGAACRPGLGSSAVQKRRLARLVLVLALLAAVEAGCGGSKAGDGQTSPPSTSGT